MWGWKLRKWDSGGRNMKLHQPKLIDMGSPRKDSEYIVASWRVRALRICPVIWLKHGPKDGPL